MNKHQHGTSDCGLFTVAFAAALCEGIDPTTLVFCQPLMRKHLTACIEMEKIEQFPTSKERRAIIKPVKTECYDVYCICRMPYEEQDTNERMIMCYKCHKWYHDTCVKVPEGYWIPGNKLKWYCATCMDKDSPDTLVSSQFLVLSAAMGIIPIRLYCSSWAAAHKTRNCTCYLKFALQRQSLTTKKIYTVCSWG